MKLWRVGVFDDGVLAFEGSRCLPCCAHTPHEPPPAHGNSDREQRARDERDRYEKEG
jgi:hypothetical protein